MKQSAGRSYVRDDPLTEAGGKGEVAFPASFAQERLWFLDQFEPGSSLYNVPTALRLQGALRMDALVESLNAIVARHESLRTTFSVVEGQTIQRVSSCTSVPVPMVDLTDLPQGEREAKAQRLAEEEARKPFHLAKGPLLRATLLRVDDEDHILQLTIHHIVSDGWSMDIFLRELATLYEAFAQGKPSSLRELPIQYGDFAVWQRAWLEGEVLEAQLSYWRKQLAGSPALLNLPTDRPRPAVQTHRGARESLRLPQPLSESLKRLSRHEGATLFMTLLAAFQVLLYRYSGQEDIVVGTPIAGRNRVEIEGLIGFFVNTLVMRADLSGNPTFRELLGQEREVCLEAYDHQDLPFERLVQELRPERSMSHSPVFQVMFAHQNVPRGAVALSELTVSRVGVEGETAKFELGLSIDERAEGLGATVEYSTDLFDAATIKRMLGHYRRLLEGIVSDPDQRISFLPLLTDAERHQIVVAWNDTRKDYPEHLCVHQLFEAQVRRTPSSVAVVLEDSQLTYRELNCRANQLAHYLRRWGVGPEAPVGVCLERSLEMIVGLLGILKAGGAYLPLDASYPKDRLAFMLNDVRASTILTSRRLVDRLPESDGNRVYLDSEWESLAKESEENPPNRTNPDNLFSIMYTSGSTGRPKGVQITHRGVVNYATAAREALGWGSGDRGLQFAPISSDLAADEIFTSLTSGATLVLRTEELLDSIPTFLKRCGEWGITVTILPTAFWHALTAQVAEENLAFPGGIRLVYFGGDRTLPERLAAWHACV
ncbi:MAG: condensation domain-containing protein, partial [Anaerolineae bacterium]